MSVKTKIKTVSWSLLGLCCVALLVAAMKAKDSKGCSKVEININGATKHLFVNQSDVINVLNENNIHAGEILSDINLKKTEDQLRNNLWIKDVELFFDNSQVLHVKITEREPVARVFTISGNSFYIDTMGLRLPISENATARLIVFTSFPSDKRILSKPDSLVLNDIKAITQYISTNNFLNAQTEQINITPQRTYEIIPVVGDQVIRIGNADSLNEKFTKLIAFYKQVISKVGFERYSVIDVQYQGQVVAVRKGESYAVSDTTKAKQQMATVDAKLNKALNDTTYAAPLSKPVIDSVNTKPDNAVAKQQVKNISNKKVNNSHKKNMQKPKAVMKKV
jgi:cell division protein FtsQ